MDKWQENFNRALASHERYWLDPDTYYKDCEEEEEEEIPTCSKCGGYNDNDELGGSWCSKCERERILFVKKTINQGLREGYSHLAYFLPLLYTDAEVVRQLAFYLSNNKEIYELVIKSVEAIERWEKRYE